jgi:hypothetical protein
LPARQIGISPPLISHGFFGSIQADPHHLKYLEYSSDSATGGASPVAGAFLALPLIANCSHSDTRSLTWILQPALDSLLVEGDWAWHVAYRPYLPQMSLVIRA